MERLKNMQLNYYVFPSVVKVGEESVVRIIPRNPQGRLDNPFHFKPWNAEKQIQHFPSEWFNPDQNAHCVVTVVPLRSWYIPNSIEKCDKFNLKVDDDGGLTVKYRFSEEEEYYIQVSSPVNPNNVIYTFSIYALKDDLYEKLPFKGDLHVHSFYSDGGDSLETNACDYRANGYDFLAITDHFKRFPSLMMKEKMDKYNFGLTVYEGEEVHVPNSSFHVVHIGGNYSVNERYIDDVDKYNKEYKEIYNSLPYEDEKFKDFIASLTWIYNANKDAGGLSIYAHPHWHWATQNMPDIVSDHVFRYGLMDAFELLGGQQVSDNNTQIALYYQYALKGKKYPIVASSDSHSTSFGGQFNQIYTIAFAKDCSFESIKKAIIDGSNVACEDVGQFRAYGDLRYVFYAHFLNKYFYPWYRELCLNLGINMKLFFEGNEAYLNTALKAQELVLDFRDKFFGRKKFNKGK